MAAADPVDLLTYGLQELQGFTNHLFGAIEHFQSTGTIPAAKFADLAGPTALQNGSAKHAAKVTAKQTKAAKALAAGEEAPAKKPRALTAFNWFVRAQINEMKSKGETSTKDEDGKTQNLMTKASAKWKELGADGQAKYAKQFQEQKEKGLIPEAQLPAARAEANKKRKAEAATAAAEAAEAAGESPATATEAPATVEKANKKEPVATSEGAQAVASPAGPVTQDGAHEEAPKKKKKKHHAAEASASPDQAATPAEVKTEEKKSKKKHKKKHRDATATAN